MKTAIVDDEKNVRQALHRLLELWCPEVEIVGEADSVQSGFNLLSEVHPELVFLDVELGDGTGFDLLRRLPNRNFSVIFATAHEHYAIPAIRASASDFLLKPIDPDELVEALKRVKENQGRFSTEALDVMLEHESGVKEKIVLRDSENIYVLNIKDLIRCEADGRHTRFYKSDCEQTILVSTNLKEYENLLSGSGFVRVHHGHLVNLAHVVRIDKANMTLHLPCNQQVPISVRKKELLLNRL
jgi:two-component system, LytTR family, response regulator